MPPAGISGQTRSKCFRLAVLPPPLCFKAEEVLSCFSVYRPSAPHVNTVLRLLHCTPPIVLLIPLLCPRDHSPNQITIGFFSGCSLDRFFPSFASVCRSPRCISYGLFRLYGPEGPVGSPNRTAPSLNGNLHFSLFFDRNSFFSFVFHLWRSISLQPFFSPVIVGSFSLFFEFSQSGEKRLSDCG